MWVFIAQPPITVRLHVPPPQACPSCGKSGHFWRHQSRPATINNLKYLRPPQSHWNTRSYVARFQCRACGHTCSVPAVSPGRYMDVPQQLESFVITRHCLGATPSEVLRMLPSLDFAASLSTVSRIIGKARRDQPTLASLHTRFVKLSIGNRHVQTLTSAISRTTFDSLTGLSQSVLSHFDAIVCHTLISLERLYSSSTSADALKWLDDFLTPQGGLVRTEGNVGALIELIRPYEGEIANAHRVRDFLLPAMAANGTDSLPWSAIGDDIRLLVRVLDSDVPKRLRASFMNVTDVYDESSS